MKSSINKVKSLVALAMMAGLVPMIHGSPAIGKSAVTHSLAREYNLKLIDMRLSQCEPTDLLGFPFVNNGRSGYAPMVDFPLEGDPLPEGYDGWLLFLDELTSAPRSVQAAAYKLVLDRMVGQHKLHPRVRIVAAGNLETDGAIVEPMSSALQSRLSHLYAELVPSEWLEWANTNARINSQITAFLQFRPNLVYTFNPASSQDTYASPRTWDAVDAILAKAQISEDNLALIAGTVGEGTAREFFAFTKLRSKLPLIQDILANPMGTSVPHEASTQYALIGALSDAMNDMTAQAVMDYAGRLPAEFQVTFLRMARLRNPKLLQHPAVTNWVLTRAHELV